MKLKRALTWILVVLCSVGVLGTNASASETLALEGRGTKEVPYRIENAEDFSVFYNAYVGGNTFAEQYVTLTQSIDLDGDTLTPPSTAFSGVFDGNGCTVKNFSVRGENAGFFGKTENAVIKGLTLENATVTATRHGGGIVGWALTSEIIDCKTESTVSVVNDASVNGGSVRTVGGIFGNGQGVTVAYCINEASVTYPAEASGTAYFNMGGIGGACGYYVAGKWEDGSKISYCINRGTITMKANNTQRNVIVGGIVGMTDSDSGGSAFLGCLNEGALVIEGKGSKENYVGGLFGRAQKGASGGMIAERCYQMGSIDLSKNQNTKTFSDSFIGFIAFDGQGVSVKDCFVAENGSLYAGYKTADASQSDVVLAAGKLTYTSDSSLLAYAKTQIEATVAQCAVTHHFAKGDDLHVLGYQKAISGTTNDQTDTFRILTLLYNYEEYRCVGYAITINGDAEKEYAKDSNKIYKSINATVASGETYVAATASEYMADGIFAVTLKNVPKSGSFTMTVTAKAYPKDGGAAVEKVVEWLIEDGTISVAS